MILSAVSLHAHHRLLLLQRTDPPRQGVGEQARFRSSDA